MQSTQDDMIRLAYEAGRHDGYLVGSGLSVGIDAGFDAWKAEPEVAGNLAIIAVPVCPFCGGSGDDPWADYEIEQGADGGPSERPAYCRVCEGERRVTTERFLSWLTEELFKHGMTCIAAMIEDEGREVLATVGQGLVLLGGKHPPEGLTDGEVTGYGQALVEALDLVTSMAMASDPD